MVFEAALIDIGIAVTKAIIKTRLKGSDVAGEVVSTVLDHFKSSGDSLLEKRKTERLIERIGDGVVESLLPVVARDGANLDEGSRTAVARAASTAIAAARLSPEDLLELDLAPGKVRVRLQAGSPAEVRLFGDAENELYGRILAEVSQQIVDAGSQTPLFTERTFAEILRRETQLLDVTSRMFAEIKKIQAQVQREDPGEASARFEEKYRRAVGRNLDVLELFGAKVSGASRRYCLSVAYVALIVGRKPGGRLRQAKPEQPRASQGNEKDGDSRSHPLREGLGTGSDREARDAKSGLEPDEMTSDGSTVHVEECLASTRRLLIRGVAGSGKTTLLQWIAVRSANSGFHAPLTDWNGTVPFFIRLRHFAEGPLPQPADFPGLVTPAIAGEMPAGWVEEQLRAGRAVVLVDGVDEVSEARQADVQKWLDDLIDAWGRNRFIVSARTHIGDDWLDREKFDTAEAQPMALSQIREFIAHWHESIRQDIEDDDERQRLLQQAVHLQSAVESTRPLRKLATNPLMCAMLCALHRETLGQLPKDRIQLYTECIQVLLERRESMRDVDYSSYPRLSLRHQKLLLQELAYYLVLNGWTSVPTAAAAQRLNAKLANMEGLPAGATMDRVLKYFVERSGVVREPVKGRMDFVHRTFQEFFAAQAAVDADDVGVLIKNAHDPEWREIVILATGLARESARDELVSGLVRRGDSILERANRAPLHLLAAATLEVSPSIGPGVKAEVDRRIAKLPPPGNDREAAGWASAGELAAPHLVRMLGPERVLAPRKRALCGRVLSQVGDPRPGVGLRSDGLPDIAWCDVPAGAFIYGSDEYYPDEPRQTITLSDFRIAKYPVTYCQFQAFIDATDGYADPRWWDGLHQDGRNQQQGGPGEQS
ncbi:MAG: NACHT domain-containing protein, partial [Capsulimonadaceae bacterium]